MTTDRKPGEWPVRDPVQLDEASEAERQHAALAGVRRERARREITLGAIRAALEEQPSERAVREAAKRWGADLAAITDEAVAKLRRTG